MASSSFSGSVLCLLMFVVELRRPLCHFSDLRLLLHCVVLMKTGSQVNSNPSDYSGSRRNNSIQRVGKERVEPPYNANIGSSLEACRKGSESLGDDLGAASLCCFAPAMITQGRTSDFMCFDRLCVVLNLPFHCVNMLKWIIIISEDDFFCR